MAGSTRLGVVSISLRSSSLPPLERMSTERAPTSSPRRCEESEEAIAAQSEGAYANGQRGAGGWVRKGESEEGR